MSNLAPALIATLNAALIRAVNLTAAVKAFAAAKAEALAACKAAPDSAPDGYAFRVRNCVRTFYTYAPADTEQGPDYVMVRAAKDAPAYAVPTLAVSPWLAYDFFSLAESNAIAAKEANAKRLLAALAEAGETAWAVDGYGKATVCKGKARAKEGAKPVSSTESAYQTEEVWTPYKAQEAAAHADA